MGAEAPPQKKKPTLCGCFVSLIFMAVILYGGITGAGLFWWGLGGVQAARAHRNPDILLQQEPLRLFNDVVISRDGATLFRRSHWSHVRNGLLFALPISIMLAVIKVARGKRFLLAFGAVAMLASAISFTGADSVTVNHATHRIEVRKLFSSQERDCSSCVVSIVPYQLGGGRSGTRHTTAWSEGIAVVLKDGSGEQRLMKLPYETPSIARLVRDLIAKRISLPASD